MIPHKHYEINKDGRDFIVGDLHGCFDDFQEKLKEIEFDKEKDRMFSVGDLVDRGPKSKECMLLVDEPWFHAVKGNHEQLMIDAVLDFHSASLWVMNGGGWYEDHDETCLKLLAERANKLPIAISVDTKKGKVGICHADPPEDWDEILTNNDTEKWNRDTLEQRMIWGRTRIQYKVTENIKNIYRTYHGHTPMQTIATLGNTVYIDTGACFKGDDGYGILTAVQIN